MLDPLLAAERAAEVREELRLDRADGEPLTVPARIDVVAGEPPGEEIVARPGDRTGREVLVEVQRHQRQHTVSDRHVQVRAVARGGATHERREDRHHRVHAAAGAVTDRRARQRGPTRRVASGAVEVAADGQVVDVVTGPLRVRAVLAVSGGRAVDDGRVQLLDGRVADAEPVDDSGPEALDHHVGGGGQRQECVATRVGLEVELGAQHVPVTGVRVERRSDLDAALLGRGPDLDHRRAVVGEPA